MSKGVETRERILRHAMAMASELGFEGLSIGELAKATDMSKSGLFAHFASKEDLQLQILDAARRSFIDHVISPALREPRGEPRIKALFDGWLAWEEGEVIPGGCPFGVASHEYDDRPGAMRDAIVATQSEWLDALATAARIAVEAGHFHRDLDTRQFAFELFGIFLVFRLYQRLLGDPDARDRARAAFDRLIAGSR